MKREKREEIILSENSFFCKTSIVNNKKKWLGNIKRELCRGTENTRAVKRANGVA